MFLTLFFLLSMETELLIAPATHFEAVPEEADSFLEFPASVAVDDQGNLLVLDSQARRVFVWDQSGKFVTLFGKRGKGPGDFEFKEWNNLAAHIAVDQSTIYVYDGGQKMLHLFDRNFKFVKRLPFLAHKGRTRYFGMNGKGNFLMLCQNYLDTSIPQTRLVLYDSRQQPLVELAEFDDPAFRIFYTGKKVSKLQIMAFAPKVTVHGDSNSDTFLVGNGAQPFFKIYDGSGELVNRVSFKIPRSQVSDKDQDEFARQPHLRMVDYYDWTFADYHPYYDAVLPMGSQFLIYRMSPFFKRVTGYVLDRSGKIGGQFNFELGESGNLFGAGGRIFAVKSDESGDLTLKELIIDAPGS